MVNFLTALGAGSLIVAHEVLAHDENNILTSRVKVAHLREASKLFTRIFKSWPSERYVPELTPWALYAAGGARDTQQVCKAIEKILLSLQKEREGITVRDGISALRDVANRTNCELPGLKWSKNFFEEVLKKTERGHDLGTAIRDVPAEDLNVPDWLKFVNEWEKRMDFSDHPIAHTYDDFFGLMDAKSYLLSLSNGSPENVLRELVIKLRDPYYNVVLKEDEDISHRLRSIERLTRTYANMLNDFGSAKLEQYKDFKSLKYAMYRLAQTLIETLSHDKPGSLGSTKLSYLLTALWRLEGTGLIYLSSRENPDSWDITLSRPLQRWDLGLYLKLNPSDEPSWRLSSDESGSYTLQALGDTGANSTTPGFKKNLPLINILNSKDEVIGEYLPGVEPKISYPQDVPVELIVQKRQTRTFERVSGSYPTINVTDYPAMLVVGSSYGESKMWTVEICSIEGLIRCKDVPIHQGDFEIDYAAIPVTELAFDRFAVNIKWPKHSKEQPIHQKIALQGQDYRFEQKGQKARIHHDENRWFIDNDLSYTFPQEYRKPEYTAIVIFTVAVWVCPFLALSRLTKIAPESSEGIISLAALLRAFRQCYIGSKLLYLMTTLYYTALVSSLIYYWAFWKLIPYSRLLIPLIILGSILTLLTLAKLEAQSRASKGAKKAPKDEQKSESTQIGTKTD